MAEFCPECWNELNEIKDPPGKYIISKEVDLCENCGKWTNVIIVEKKHCCFNVLRKILFPLRIIFFPIELVIRLILGIIRLIRMKNGQKE